MISSLIRRARIGTKLSVCTFLAIGGLFGAFIAATSAISAREAEQDAVRQVIDQSALLGNSVHVLDQTLRSEVAAYAKVFQSRMPQQFEVRPDQPVEVAGKTVPLLAAGDSAVNLNFSLVDSFTALTGAYATIFVRQGDDFIRVTTSHKKENGERAIGTALDRSHPGYPALLQGRPYAGSANLFGGQYMTRYDPIRNGAGQVIGILYVGIDFTASLRALGEGIKSLTLGRQGGFYVLSARAGKDLGRALIHRQREGQALLEAADADGQAFVRTMLAQKNGTLRYLEPGANGAAARERIAAFSTLEDWQMLVVGDAYLDEITAGALAQRNRHALIGLLMVAAVTAALYLLIRRMVAQPIGQALAVVETVATGNLAARVEVRSEDESGRLMASMDQMTARLSTVVTEVRQGTEQVAAASRQVACGNMELSTRTEQQASALEETAASMEEMNAAVRQNARNAGLARQQAHAASSTARQGGAAVGQLVDKMDAISASATRIADIVGVMDGIAFQTNILALNAAVEAAHAGEQGRGFAVVAAEVRNLAQRAGGAAREIKALIEQSIGEVNEGAALAGRAGSAMGEVVQAIDKVSGSIDEISSATQEQAMGIEQINQAIAQLDEVTQQNAALVEEAAAAAQSMLRSAERQAKVIEFFVVRPEQPSTPPRARPAVPQQRTRAAGPIALQAPAACAA